jgi:hypothetical protein
MPDSTPSNAPEEAPDRVRDETSAAAAMRDADLDKTPGGGGLGGDAAAEPVAGSLRGSRGASPNTPGGAAVPEPEIDGRSADPGTGHATADAKIDDGSAVTDDPYPHERR